MFFSPNSFKKKSAIFPLLLVKIASGTDIKMAPLLGFISTRFEQNTGSTVAISLTHTQVIFLILLLWAFHILTIDGGYCTVYVEYMSSYMEW
jgi:hypothetical protein